SHWFGKLFTQKSMSRRASSDRKPRSGRPTRLTLEALEDRLTPTFTWTGGSTVDSNWSTGANWMGGIAPTVATAASDTLVFGTGKARMTNINNITGLSLGEITLAGGYSISGKEVTLTGTLGIDNISGNNSFSDPITLAGPNNVNSVQCNEDS